MNAQARPVRAGRNRPVVAVTGAGSGLGRECARRLAGRDDVRTVVAIDSSRGDLRGVSWRTADMRDPQLRTALDGVDVVVHLGVDTSPDSPTDTRRALNVRGTATVLTACAAAGVRRALLVTSAMVYGAHADNPVPLPEDAPLRAVPDDTLVGDWLEMEGLAEAAARGRPVVDVTVLRPATLVGPGADAVLARHFEGPRLLLVRGTRPHWQFCHVDDLLAAVELAALGRVGGALTVGSEGWLEQDDVERVADMRRIVLPAAVAYGTAERLHRIGVSPAPAGDLGYLAHPWVVGAQRLRAAGWEPAYDNEAALRAHLDGLGERGGGRFDRRDATRAAAGATVALVGTVAIARARARRRR